MLDMIREQAPANTTFSCYLSMDVAADVQVVNETDLKG